MDSQTGSSLAEGIRLLKARSLADAQAHLIQAVDQDPQNAQAQMYLGICLIQRGESAAGLGSLRNAANLAPSDPAVLFNLAAALVQTGQNVEARQTLEQVVQIDPTNAKARAALAALPDAAATPTPAESPTAGRASLADWPGTQSNPPEADSAPANYTSGPQAPQAPPNYSSQAPPPQTPPSYASPAPANPASAGGMHPAVAARSTGGWREPSAGQMIARGLGWGWLYGQVWTGWNLFWFIVWGAAKMAPTASPAGFYIVLAIVFLFLFGAAGFVVGLIIGAAKLDINQGALAGSLMGLVLMGGEFLLTGGSASSLINIIFWWFTGRIVGRGIARRVNQVVAA